MEATINDEATISPERLDETRPAVWRVLLEHGPEMAREKALYLVEQAWAVRAYAALGIV